jgi:hypothetical protein
VQIFPGKFCRKNWNKQNSCQNSDSCQIYLQKRCQNSDRKNAYFNFSCIIFRRIFALALYVKNIWKFKFYLSPSLVKIWFVYSFFVVVDDFCELQCEYDVSQDLFPRFLTLVSIEIPRILKNVEFNLLLTFGPLPE